MAKNTGSLDEVAALLMTQNLEGQRNWHSTYAIKEVGGPHALRRLRELRRQGTQITARRVSGSQQWEYRII